MIGPRSLRGRLLAAQIILVAIVIGAGMLTVRFLTPALFERGLRTRRGTLEGSGPSSGSGRGQREPNADLAVPADVQDVYDDALTNAVVIASVVGLVAAFVLAIVFSRVLLRRINAIHLAARRLATGDYHATIEVPPEAELAELAVSVNTLAATLAASESARARLMSDVAHEIRNPLTTIEGYMEGLIDGVLPAEVETYTEVADEAHRLKRIAEDLSFMSRAQEDAVRYEMDAIDLADLAHHAIERLRPLSTSAGVDLVSSLDMPLPVTADPGRITQALTNLIKNGLAHTPAGGTVTVTGRRAGADCEIVVADTGDGIPADRLEIIFERFTRFREGAGIGIGLNIARSIALGHQGRLTADSPGTGHGATFTLTLPRRD